MVELPSNQDIYNIVFEAVDPQRLFPLQEFLQLKNSTGGNSEDGDIFLRVWDIA